jgi:D-arabinose 1-dehydrogenase-like Zn-dependent alcohol dehydrogenase
MVRRPGDSMRAERFYAGSRSVVVEDVPIPDLRAGEVLVRVGYCGICHSDLSLINQVVPARLPVVTQGHEASGEIAELGPEVSGWAEGDRVIVAAGRACMACGSCKCGDPANCLRTKLMAFDYDGAWAEYTVAQAVGLTRVPTGMSLEHAAILADAVSTPYGAVVRTGKVRIGEAVGVWGAGGVGSHVVQLARLAGAAPVIAVDIEPTVLERALQYGADYAFDARDKRLSRNIAEITGGRRLDVAFDVVGLKSSFEQALDSVTVGGRLVVVGVSGESPTVGSTARFAVARKQVLGHLGYRNADVLTLTELVSRGRLDLSRSIGEVVALEDIVEVVSRGARTINEHVRILVKP